MSQQQPQQPQQEITFEQAMQQLEQTVRSLESGELPLDTSLKAFEDGNKLVKYCTAKLNQAEKKVEVLLGQNADGTAAYGEFGGNSGGTAGQ